MEDCKIATDLSVRKAGSIIQFVYGEDGMDYNKIENQNSSLVRDKFEDIKRRHLFDENEDPDF